MPGPSAMIESHQPWAGSNSATINLFCTLSSLTRASQFVVSHRTLNTPSSENVPQGSQWLFPWGIPSYTKTEMAYQGISLAFESNAGQSVKPRGVKPKGFKRRKIKARGVPHRT
jgi:hypothetical protein